MTKRKKRGYAIAELPAGIMLFLLGIAFPMVILASVFYRVYMFDATVKGGCQIGANQANYTTAKTAAAAFIASHQTTGMQIAPPVCSLITKNIAYNDASGARTYKAYFLQIQATGSVEPLLHQTFFGVSIPGLTTALPMQMVHALYFENQTAAASGT